MIKKFINFLKLSNNPSFVEKHIPKEDEDSIIQKIFNNDFYNEEHLENAESWLFYNYFNHGDSLSEKKYKLATLSLVCNQKRLYLNKMPLILDIVKEFSQQLIDSGETSINLYEAFPIYSEFPTPRKYRNKVIGIELISQFLVENQNINMVKQVYETFSTLGLLAHNFIRSQSCTDLFMDLQDSQFTQNDILVFRQFIKEVTDPKYDSYHTVLLSPEKWKPLILNEYSVDNLNLFKQVCLNDKGKLSGSLYGGGGIKRSHINNTRPEDKQYLIDLLEKRIAYIELDNDLELPTETQNIKFKRPKL